MQLIFNIYAILMYMLFIKDFRLVILRSIAKWIKNIYAIFKLDNIRLYIDLFQSTVAAVQYL